MVEARVEIQIAFVIQGRSVADEISRFSDPIEFKHRCCRDPDTVRIVHPNMDSGEGLWLRYDVIIVQSCRARANGFPRRLGWRVKYAWIVRTVTADKELVRKKASDDRQQQ